LIAGGRGNDTAFLGAGDDTFVWNPGDGSDTLEGQDGHDAMLFNGANTNEKIDISGSGSRVRFTRDVANITMDLNGVEQVNLTALGGADSVTIHDLTGTSVTAVNVDLATPPGSGTGDGQPDTVTVEGTNGNDAIQIQGNGSSFTVAGLWALVSVTGSEGANDSLVVNALGGDDTVSASTMAAGIVKLTEDGGAGNDTMIGSDGNDMLLGGDGNDTIVGGRGNDVAQMGDGRDTFVWNPGDGSDVVEGQGGFDTMLFNGANVDENIDISANGSRLRFVRNVGNVVNGCQRHRAGGLQRPGRGRRYHRRRPVRHDVTEVNLDLAGTPGSGVGDTQADTVIVNGTPVRIASRSPAARPASLSRGWPPS